MKVLKKLFVSILKQADLGSAIAVRLTKLTGKSKVPIHPKHLLTEKPWFIKYIKKNDVVLDLGCGNGQNSIKTAKLAKVVIGVDISQDLLNLAKKSAQLEKVSNITFGRINLEEKLRLKDESFEKLLFLDVLEHLKNRNQILSEARRVLKPKGLLLLGVPNSQTSWKKLQRSVGISSFSDPDHKIEFSENQIKNLLKKHGFKIEYFGYGVYDTPLRGLFDVVGGLSLSIYRILSQWRKNKAKQNPQEASGFEIVAENNK